MPMKSDESGNGASLIPSIDLRVAHFTVSIAASARRACSCAAKAGATELRIDGANLSGVLRIPGQN